MKISVLGSIILDQYIKDGKTRETYGGINYVLSTLSILYGNSATIYPVCTVNEDHYENIIKLWKQYKNINPKYVKKHKKEINRFRMYYDKVGRKYNSFFYKNNQVIPQTLIKQQYDSDIMIISFMSGNEISEQQLTEISKNKKGLLIGDIHNYIIDNTSHGSQIFKEIRKSENWIRNFDILQGSTFEWEFLLKSSPLNNYTDHLIQYKSNEIKKKVTKVGEGVLTDNRFRILLITDGRFGAFAVYKDKNNKIVCSHRVPHKFTEVKDTTGCGDTFLSAFSYIYSQTSNIRKALNYAVNLSSIKTQVFGLWTDKKYKDLKNSFTI
jgi:sugar/nucleoside kinase (ribokinase family)